MPRYGVDCSIFLKGDLAVLIHSVYISCSLTLQFPFLESIWENNQTHTQKLMDQKKKKKSIRALVLSGKKGNNLNVSKKLKKGISRINKKAADYYVA